MTGGRKIYLSLCDAPDLFAAVSRLSCEELTEVAAYLAGGRKRGIAAQVWGEVQQALTEMEQSGK